MQLADSLRESLVDELETLIKAYGSNPDNEAIAEFVIEQLEIYADEAGEDDLIVQLEESGELDTPLLEALETEMSSNDEFEHTGEEVVSLLERLCGVEWVEIDDDDEEEEDYE